MDFSDVFYIFYLGQPIRVLLGYTNTDFEDVLYYEDDNKSVPVAFFSGDFASKNPLLWDIKNILAWVKSIHTFYGR